MLSPYFQKAVYSLDLVALMAGGHFQDTANLFVERMERHAELESNAAPTTATAQHSDRIPANTTHGKTATNSVDAKATSSAPQGGLHIVEPVEPRFKKAKGGASFGAGREPGGGGGVRRVRLPPLDVFQREYMETATPVILTGVSAALCFLACFRVLILGCVPRARVFPGEASSVVFFGCGQRFRQVVVTKLDLVFQLLLLVLYYGIQLLLLVLYYGIGPMQHSSSNAKVLFRARK